VTCDAGSTVTIELDSLNIPVDTSNEIVVEDEDGNQEAGREEVGDQAQTVVNSGSGPDYQICIPLGCAPWVRVTYSGQTQKGLY
jgi:hypothetical protein